MEGTRDNQNSRTSTRLTDRRKLEVEEEERKMKQERKRAKTMFQRKSKVIGPNDMIVDTSVGKINLGSENVSEDVKVKVELNDLKEAADLSGFSEGQGEVIVTQEVNLKSEDAPGMEDEDGDGNPVDNSIKNYVTAEGTGHQLLTAMVEQLRKEMKHRLEEQDQKIAQLTTELEAVKEESAAKINQLQETIAQLQLSSTNEGRKEVPEGTAATEELVSTNRQLQGQVSQGHLMAQDDLDLQVNSDENDMAMLSPGSNDKCVTVVKHPEGLESLPRNPRRRAAVPKIKSRKAKIDAPLFEAVLNILVEQKRSIAGNINWSSVCGLMKKCRLVCKSWKASVDSVLQTHPSHLEFGNPSDLKKIGNMPHTAPFPLTLSTVGEPWDVRLPLDIAQSEMGQFIMSLPSSNPDSNYNPLPTRHLSVRTTRFPSHRGFVLGGCCRRPLVKIKVYQISDYLRVIGHQVWYLRLSLGRRLQASEFDDVCSSLSEILHLVPNLRLLSLKLDHAVSKAERITLSEMEYQFPRLKDLVAVECQQENPVIVQILKANSHVRRLAFHQLWYRESTGILKLDLPNLSELFIPYNTHIKMDLFKKANVTWKIRKLHLLLSFPRALLSVNFIQPLIDGLTIFGNSLEDLKLDFGNRELELEGMQLELPRLKRLHVQTKKWDGLEWGMFLAELKLLETLEIVGEVEEHAMVGSFHEEHDWLSMPELRSVTLIAKKRLEDPIVPQEERTVCTVCKLKRAGMPTVKFNYINVSFS